MKEMRSRSRSIVVDRLLFLNETHLQEDPDPGAKASNRPGDKDQKE
jgi:hypothetical protein